MTEAHVLGAVDVAVTANGRALLVARMTRCRRGHQTSKPPGIGNGRGRISWYPLDNTIGDGCSEDAPIKDDRHRRGDAAVGISGQACADALGRIAFDDNDIVEQDRIW